MCGLDYEGEAEKVTQWEQLSRNVAEHARAGCGSDRTGPARRGSGAQPPLHLFYMVKVAQMKNLGVIREVSGGPVSKTAVLRNSAPFVCR